ncbi:hypothetical protein F4781DRAFT_435409 [Annulohypoxylon bovei var. microspora]|nr:hypothetical protein F4781DRAFT_435409 [Annulohypoxylon bovei var. microspora]
MEALDCVVIGAGWNGLAAARQYRSGRPNDTIAVFDKESSLGGVWCKDRLYPGLKSNNLLGTFEYPDFPMSSDRFGVLPDQHIPGHVIHEYLEAYAKTFELGGFIRLDTEVLTAEHRDAPDGGWVLAVKPLKDRSVKILARRLIVATGVLSAPSVPRFQGQDEFRGRIFHTRYFAENSDSIRTSKAVTVVGAGKSAWDAVYEYATAGVKVNWVIRAGGHGPVWMSPPRVTPFKQWIEKLANMRVLSWFSPCIWGDADGYGSIRKFYHATALGRLLTSLFWKILGRDVMTINDYDSHPDTAKLKPWVPVMYVAGSYSFLNYERDFFELVKSDMIDIHIDEISHLSLDRIHLASGITFRSDVLVASTGWNQIIPVKFLPEGVEKELNIPHAVESADTAPPADLGNQQALVALADEEIFRRFPILKEPPVWNKNFVSLRGEKDVGLTPYMLHRFLVPPSPRFLRSRDIAFIGLQNNLGTTTTAHITALWISAYFSGQLARDPARVVDDEEATKKLQYEAVLHNRFGKWRYPVDWGDRAPNYIFDAMPYLDMLQRDLGLDPHRKKSKLAEMFVPYGPEDYRNINQEWLQRRDVDGASN